MQKEGPVIVTSKLIDPRCFLVDPRMAALGGYMGTSRSKLSPLSNLPSATLDSLETVKGVDIRRTNSNLHSELN